MRVGFFGNTNNYPFILANAFCQLGHDVEFVVDQKDPLYRPDSRNTISPRVGNLRIHDLSPARFRHHLVPSGNVRHAIRILQSCDAVLLNQYGPSLGPRIGRPSIALLTGSDLYVFANPAALDSLVVGNGRAIGRLTLALRRILFAVLIGRQRAGISRSVAVSYAPSGFDPEGDRLLAQLGVSEDRRISLLIADTNSVVQAPLPMNDVPQVLCIARLNWKKPYREGMKGMDYKGTDVMLKGIALYVSRTARPLSVHMVRKGRDIAETEQLIRQLNLEGLVTWHDEMPQAKLLERIRAADLVLEQFGESFPSVGALEALAAGRPVIANWRFDQIPQYKAVSDQLCNATNADELAVQLESLLSNRDLRRHFAFVGRAIVDEYFSAQAAAKSCLAFLEHCVSGRDK